jgi:hypothetical protein
MAKLVFRFRVTFEDVDDVERIIDITAQNTFRDFHNIIQEAINFDNVKPASFFKANDNWRGSEEFCTEPKQNAKAAGASELGKFIEDPHQKFLYVYDVDGAHWNLRAELMKLFRGDDEYPKVFKSIGVSPKQYVDPKLLLDDPAAKLFKEADSLIGSLLGGDDDEEEEDDEEDEKDDFNLFGDEVDESEIDQDQINDGAPEQ